MTVFNTIHIPVFSKTKHNCEVCYAQTKNANCCHTVVQHSEMCIYIVTVKKIVSKHSILEIIINDLHLK